MAFLPDTNVWISLLKNPGGNLDARVRSQPVTDIFLCAVVKAELWHGAEKYGNRERRLRALDLLFAPFASLPFDDAAARQYAELRHHLEVQGRSWVPTTSRSQPSPRRTD
jgi:tRNA(fMet)-specific endonuclease VapC